MPKVAQVVLTKTIGDNWKISVMSLTQVESVESHYHNSDLLVAILKIMTESEWEQLSLDI